MVVAPDHVGDLHVHVIHHDTEIIGGCTVGAGNDQIVELAVLKYDAAMHHVIDDHFSGERILESHDRSRARRCTLALAPASVVARLLTACSLLRPHLLQLFLAAVAAVGFAGSEQLFDDVLVPVEALSLKEGTLVMIESGPLQAVQNLLDGFGSRALQIRIFNAQNELSGVTPGVQPAEKRGSQSADVQETGRTGSESGTDCHGPDRGKLRGAEFSRALGTDRRSGPVVCLRGGPMSYSAANYGRLAQRQRP